MRSPRDSRRLARKIGFVVTLFVGAVLVYRTQSAYGDHGEPALVEAPLELPVVAYAAQRYTRLAEGSLASDSIAGGTLETEAIDVSAYREVVLYVHGSEWSCPRTSVSSPLSAQWRIDASMPFGSVGNGELSAGARLRVDGAQLKVRWNKKCVGALSYVVAGVTS